MKPIRWRLAVAGILVVTAHTAVAANVKITPLGSHDGEFCRRDRAMVFEDPDGTRILYDAGMTVAGPNDPRLGKIDAVLLSSVHGDHLGAGVALGQNVGDNHYISLPRVHVVDAIAQAEPSIGRCINCLLILPERSHERPMRN